MGPGPRVPDLKDQHGADIGAMAEAQPSTHDVHVVLQLQRTQGQVCEVQHLGKAGRKPDDFC